MISGIVVILLMAGAAALTLWAWSASRKAAFTAAARIALDDEPDTITLRRACCGDGEIDHE